MKKVSKFGALYLIICFGTLGILKAQDRPSHEVHAMMIYNFLKYIQWPGEQNTGEFTIGVIGDDAVFNTLTEWYGNKTRGDKSFVIKKFSTADEVGNCQLLYIAKAASQQFEQIHAKVRDTATLTITDKGGLGEKGSCINFKVVDNRLKFELNQAAIEKSKLKISSQLTSMAILI